MNVMIDMYRIVPVDDGVAIGDENSFCRASNPELTFVNNHRSCCG